MKEQEFYQPYTPKRADCQDNNFHYFAQYIHEF